MLRMIMSYLKRRLVSMQNKFGSVFVVGLITVCLMLFVFIRIERDVERLDATRIRLEDALASYGGNMKVRSSVAGLNQYDVMGDDAVVVYNRVPKTGSTSFVGIAYDLCIKNTFHVLHVNVSKNNHVLSLVDQMRFASNVTNWSAVKPAFYHGHMAFIDFSRFGTAIRPIYINVVRDPVDRLVSYYYFLRNGDDFRPHLKRRRAGDRETFDDCFANEGHDCSIDELWMQIPFFCGHAAECWVIGSEWALQMAKLNLVNHYLVVGLTEEMEDFVAVLQAAMPRYFAGALDLYNTANRSHLRKTYKKMPPSAETVRRIQQSTIWKMENEFYEFAKTQFHFVKHRTLLYSNGRSVGARSQQFVYEKIRPR